MLRNYFNFIFPRKPKMGGACMKPTNSKNKNMRAYEEAMARGEFREDLAIAATIE